MKKILAIALLAVAMTGWGATLQRTIPTTSGYTRGLLTNETAIEWRSRLGIGTNIYTTNIYTGSLVTTVTNVVTTNITTILTTNYSDAVSGLNIDDGTINSNKLDAPTKAQLSLAGGAMNSQPSSANLTNWAQIPTNALQSIPTGVISNNQNGVTLSGTFNGNGSGLSNITATSWSMVSNAAHSISLTNFGSYRPSSVLTMTNSLAMILKNDSPTDMGPFLIWAGDTKYDAAIWNWPSHGSGASELMVETGGSIAIIAGVNGESTQYRGYQFGVEGSPRSYMYMQHSGLKETNALLNTSIPIMFKANYISNGVSYNSGTATTASSQNYMGMYGEATSTNGDGSISFMDGFDTTWGNWTNNWVTEPRFRVRMSPVLNRGGISVQGGIHVNGEAGFSTNYALPSGNIMRYRSGVLTSIAPYAWDSDATNFLTFIGNPVSPGNAIATTVNSLVVNAKLHGWWTNCDAIYPMVGGTSNTMCWNLKATNAFKLLGVNAPASVWTTNGLVGDGTAYINTQFNPSTAGGNYTLNSAHMMAYTASHVADSMVMGTYDGTSRAYLIASDYLSAAYIASGGLNNNTSSDPITSSPGFILASRTGLNTMDVYSGLYTRPAYTTNTVALPNASIDILSGNYNGNHSSFCKSGVTVLGATIGSGLDKAKAGLMYQDWKDFVDKVNGPVWQEPEIRFATNSAPANVTVGTTVPDEWLSITNAAGQQRFIPVWIAH